MIEAKVRKELLTAYPGANVLVTTRIGRRVTEMVAELGPLHATSDKLTPFCSIAIAVIEKSKEHWHEKTWETYIVEKGSLNVYVDGKLHMLQEGPPIVIQPGQRHWAEGKQAWVRVISTPPYDPEDVYSKEV